MIDVKNKNLGENLRQLREEKGLPLRTVAAFLDVDQAILSKIERGQRRANREQVLKLADYFNVKAEELLLAWLSDQVLYEVENEELAIQALQIAEERLAYKAFLKIDRTKILDQIKAGVKKFPPIQKVWMYGSFSRQDDGPKSDIDLAIQTDENISYFDLAEIQYQLEKTVNRKIDIGFMDSFKPHILENVKPDLKLIYER